MEGVDLESVQVLVELIADRTAMEKDLLERRFGERARSFLETLLFMKAMKSLTEKDREIIRDRNLDSIQEALKAGERIFNKHIVKLIVDSPTSYGSEMRRVLTVFRIEQGKAWLSLEDSGGVNYATRNIFLKAEAIRFDHETGTYVINNWFHRYFVRACYIRGTTPDTLDKVLKENSAIGLAAELQVLELELATVGHRDAEQVFHIAKENTNAGFDIASTRRDELTDQLRMRMIEVKAVSSRNWAFTLTRNEYRVATENTDTYFLYLVPVLEGKPEVSIMQVIQNPVKELQDQDKWTIGEGDWNVSKVNKNG